LRGQRSKGDHILSVGRNFLSLPVRIFFIGKDRGGEREGGRKKKKKLAYIAEIICLQILLDPETQRYNYRKIQFLSPFNSAHLGWALFSFRLSFSGGTAQTAHCPPIDASLLLFCNKTSKKKKTVELS
jgi:hypothetical protein